MSKSPAKDFGPIADDYAFFERHATEAREDVRAYVEVVSQFVPQQGPLRMLDFGCGTGRATAQFLKQIGWTPARLRLTLVEPVNAARQQASARLAEFSAAPIASFPALRDQLDIDYDVILANHVLYYVPELRDQLSRLIGALCPSGVFVTAIAGRTNALIDFWITGFRLLGQEIPYYTSEDVESALQELEAGYQRQQIGYELSFPDTEENRMHIIRFLLADYLPRLPLPPLLALFDAYRRDGRIEIHTACDHYTIRPPAKERTG